MTASELHRKLLYCGYDDMSAYLKNKPINQYMHKMMHNLCEKHQIEVPVLTLFNEVYYQCVRIQYDGNPGVGLHKRYLLEEGAWLQSELAAELVFCMVWALYKRKKRLIGKEDEFLCKITPLIADSVFMGDAKGFVHYMEMNGLYSVSVFSTMPIPIDQIPNRIELEYHTSMTLKEKIFRFFSLPVESSARDFNPWRNVTNNYSYKVIRFYITLFKDRRSQLELLERIKSACTKEEFASHKYDFAELEDEILYGEHMLSSCFYADNDVDWETGATDAEIRDSRLNCGEGSEMNPVEEYEAAASSAMAVSAGQLIEGFNEEQLRSPRIRSLIGGLLAVQAYSSYDVFISYRAEDAVYAEAIADFLERTQLKVEVDDKSGKITSSAEVMPRCRYLPCSYEIPNPDDKEKTVTIEANDGKTVYQIQNLNIYITAEVVHQLNVNPQEVINHYHELIKAEVEKIAKK